MKFLHAPRSGHARPISLAAAILAFHAGAMGAAAPQPDYDFPPAANLPKQRFMPDPFKKPDGTRVANMAEWQQQRAYLRDLLQHYLYGRLPPRPVGDELSYRLLTAEPFTPADTNVRGIKQRYEVTVRRQGKEHSFPFTLYRPDTAGRLPVLINNRVDDPYGAAEGVRRGYVFVEYERNEVAPDDPANRDRSTGIFRLYPDYDFYTIGAWAWAYQPVIDVLDRLDVIDLTKIAVTGHSRGGQTAMAGAIFDERIALVAPSAGGPFTVGSFRQRDRAGYRGTSDYATRLREQFPHWYHPRYYEFAGEQWKLPWEAPTLIALIAPRPLLNLNAVEDGINNALGIEVGIRTGMRIYDWMGAGQWCRVHWRDVSNSYGQKGHDQGAEEYNAIYDYMDEFFRGRQAGPSTFNRAPNSDSWLFDPEQHPLLIDWNVPSWRYR